MHVDSEPIWGVLAADIEAGLTLKNDEYFGRYRVNVENPLAPFEPKHLKFFGPQMLNIFIASSTYGWTFDGTNNNFSWPPAGLADSLARIRAAYPQWNEYKLLMYGDRTLSLSIADSELDDMLSDTFEQLETLCTDNMDIGFRWMGEIPSLPDPSFFNSVITNHYSS